MGDAVKSQPDIWELKAECDRAYKRQEDERKAELDRLRAMHASAEQSSDTWHQEAERLKAAMSSLVDRETELTAELSKLNERLQVTAGRLQEREDALAASQERVRELERPKPDWDGKSTLRQLQAKVAERDARIAELQKQLACSPTHNLDRVAGKMLELQDRIEALPAIDWQTRAETAERELGKAIKEVEFQRKRSESAENACLKTGQDMQTLLTKAESDLDEARKVIEAVRAFIVRVNMSGISPEVLHGDCYVAVARIRALIAPPTTEPSRCQLCEIGRCVAQSEMTEAQRRTFDQLRRDLADRAKRRKAHVVENVKRCHCGAVGCPWPASPHIGVAPPTTEGE